MKPKIIKGGNFKDHRGELKFNNSFDLSPIKRFYSIIFRKNNEIRGWQGHKIEQRWFSAISGNFTIKLIKVDNWEKPGNDLDQFEYKLESNSLDVLYVPAGYLTCLISESSNSIILSMSDYSMDEINDNYKFSLKHFKINSIQYEKN